MDATATSPTIFVVRTSAMITTDLRLSNCASVFGDPQITIAQFDWFTHHCKIAETSDGDFRFRQFNPDSKEVPQIWQTAATLGLTLAPRPGSILNANPGSVFRPFNTSRAPGVCIRCPLQPRKGWVRVPERVNWREVNSLQRVASCTISFWLSMRKSVESAGK